jgi:pimeloyl-ACP methyl ester carboxylesterase
MARLVLGAVALCCLALTVSAKSGNKLRRASTASGYNPIEGMNAPQIIAYWGYPVETHPVTTEDGYILTMFRIPKPGAPPVYLQHGFLDSADTWLMNSPTESLAFILYDAGYDVWLGNARGNQYAQAHTTYPVNSKEFWAFSWDQMAQYDIVAMAKFVTSTNGAQNCTYVGHSQGTTMYFANAVMYGTALPLINAFVGLAPITFIGHTTSPILRTAADLHLDNIIDFFDDKEFELTPAFAKKWCGALCEDDPTICDDMIAAFSGYDKAYFNMSNWDVYASHFPSPTSVYTFVHWLQIIRSMGFAMFDYGLITNLEKYGQATPPKYDLTQYQGPPLYLHHGGADMLCDPTDFQTLASTLPSSSITEIYFYPPWGHLDFVWGLDAVQCYAKILDILPPTYASP